MSYSAEIVALAPAERALVERAGVRLGSELRIAINDLPLELRSNARVLARSLSLDVALCQSVLDAVHTIGDGMQTAGALLGTVSTARFVRALERRLGRRIEALSVAIEQHAQVMGSIGATPAIVTARIEESHRASVRGGRQDQGWRDARKTAFEAVSKFTSARADILADIRLVQRDGTDAKLLMETALTTLIGLRTRGIGFPIASHTWQVGREPEDVPSRSGAARVARPPLLVKEFSTYPLPIVSPRDGGTSNMSLIDVRLDDSLESVDVAQERVALRLPAPSEDDPLWSCAVSARTPTKRLIVTYLIPREFAESGDVTAAGYFWHPALSEDPARHWHERLPGTPAPESLGIGMERIGHPSLPRMTRMAEYLFERCGVSAKEYAAYRMDVEYPVWGALYYLTFDFRK